jgi:uncharacterized protein (DUF169 family)
MYNVSKINELGKLMKDLLDLNGSPVGVKLIRHKDEYNSSLKLKNMRYCQALMMARYGTPILLDEKSLVCPAASRAFGFRDLPEGLKSGKGLVCFGITKVDEVGKNMFENMPHLEKGEISYIELYSLDNIEKAPDVVVVEDEVEKLMWVNLAYLNNKKGERIVSSTSVLQATCVDSTVVPYLNKKLNFSFGCYGCRDATNIKAGEAILGFPIEDLEGIVSHLEYLSKKAMPNSRTKKTFKMFQKQIKND